MMKLGFSTVACTDYDYKDIIKSAIKNNMQGVEIRLDRQNRLFGLEGEAVSLMTKEFFASGISITDLGTSIDMKGYSEAQINTAKNCIDLAQSVGAKGIRIFLGNFSRLFSGYGNYDYDGIVSALKKICEYAQTTSVDVWIETHNEFSTGKVLKKLIEDVGSESLKIIWDIIHPYEVGEKPSETMQYIGDKIAHVHIKDGVNVDDEDVASYVYTKLGEGELPVGEIVKLLLKNNYDGHFSLEWESMWRPEIRDIYSNLEDVLDAYNKFMDNIL